jgi:hypothetical protein
MSTMVVGPIDDAGLRDRLFRNCETMVAHLAARGITAGPMLLERVAILDVGNEQRGIVPFRDLLTLHNDLAEAIRPALPQAVELMWWDRQREGRPGRPRLNFLAPVAAMRWLMACALFSLLLFLLSVVAGIDFHMVSAGLPAFNENAQFCMAESRPGCLGRWYAVWLVIYFLSLGAIGACFSTLYKAWNFVLDGTYDPQHGSSYAIRVTLGILAGFLLSQVLPNPSAPSSIADPNAEEMYTEGLTVFGRTVLALLGGFAGDLVYKILNKLVTAVETLFEGDPRQYVQRMTSEATARAQADSARKEQAQRAETIALLNEIATQKNEESRLALVRNFSLRSAGGADASAKAIVDQVSATVIRARQTADYLRRAIVFLPNDEGQPLREALDRIETGISRIERIEDRGQLLAEVAKLGATQLAKDQLKSVLTSSLSRVAAPLGALGLTPVGLAAVLFHVTATQVATAYQRWKAAVLGTDYMPDLLPVDPINAATVKTALAQLPDDVRSVLDRGDDMAAWNRLGRDAIHLPASEFFASHARGYVGQRSAFDAGVEGLRRALQMNWLAKISEKVAEELPPSALDRTGIADATRLMKAFEQLRDDPDTLAELEKLFLLASATRDGTDPQADLSLLQESLTEISAAGGRSP